MIGIHGKPIVFYISTIEISFQNSTAYKSHHIEASKVNDSRLKLTFYNFLAGNVLGNKIPMQLGYFDGKLLSLTYRVSTLFGKTGHTLQYTWLTKSMEQ